MVAILAVGDDIPASLLDGLIPWLNPWSTYVPVLAASITNPTLGTGSSQVGRYVQVGKTVIGDALITFGTSGTNAGSGGYTITLPVAAATATVSPIIGDVFIGCAGLSTRAFALLSTASTVQLRYPSAAVNGALSSASNSAPGAWTVNDNIRVHFRYEAA